jgi:hypothetical protein
MVTENQDNNNNNDNINMDNNNTLGINDDGKNIWDTQLRSMVSQGNNSNTIINHGSGSSNDENTITIHHAEPIMSTKTVHIPSPSTQMMKEIIAAPATAATTSTTTTTTSAAATTTTTASSSSYMTPPNVSLTEPAFKEKATKQKDCECIVL